MARIQSTLGAAFGLEIGVPLLALDIQLNLVLYTRKNDTVATNANRRLVLQGLAAAILTAASGPQLLAAPRPFFERIGRPIGLQLYMLGDEPVKDLGGAFAQIATIGYREVELPSLLDHKPAELKAAADLPAYGDPRKSARRRGNS